MEYISPFINVLLIVAFIIDRLFRLKSIKEYKEAKEAQIANLKQHLEIVKENNDIEVAEMHKKRYENLKIILSDRESELETNKNVLLDVQTALEKANKESHIKGELGNKLIQELNRIEKIRHGLEVDKKELQYQIDNVFNHPGLPLLSNFERKKGLAVNIDIDAAALYKGK